MTTKERARAAAFVQRLEKEQRPQPLAVSVEASRRFAMVLVALALVLVFAVAAPDGERENLAAITPEVPRRPMALVSEAAVSGAGWNDNGANSPGHGDICGQRVCERLPSCCEGAWDEACDAELLHLTRTPGPGTLTNVGRCYWHDQDSCQTCSCPMYLKRWEIMSQGGDSGISLGYDGGTGCLRTTGPLLRELKWMCRQGYCEQ